MKSIIRLYFIPKGYRDFVCDSISFRLKEGKYVAVIIGGENDGEEYQNVRGAVAKKE